MRVFLSAMHSPCSALDSRSLRVYISCITKIVQMDCFMIRRVTPPAPMPLRIEGCNVRMTPSPDNAELAAHVLLGLTAREFVEPKPQSADSTTRNASFYQSMSARIKDAQAFEYRMAIRCLVWCEQELQKNGSPDLLEKELYKHTGTVDRHGGELKRRWQHCLAMCIVRQMPTVYDAETEDTPPGNNGG